MLVYRQQVVVQQHLHLAHRVLQLLRRQLAFPHHNHLPSVLLKHAVVLLVALLVTADLATQNSRLDEGILQHAEFIKSLLTLNSLLLTGGSATPCPCQKHPLTNIAVLYGRSTISGFPGTLFTFSRYLYPCPHSHRRTFSSGFVPEPLICDMHLCRCSGVIVSVIGQ